MEKLHKFLGFFHVLLDLVMHVLTSIAVGTGAMEKILLAGLGFVVGVQVDLLFELISAVGETALLTKKKKFKKFFFFVKFEKEKKFGKFNKIGSNYRKNQKRKKNRDFFF